MDSREAKIAELRRRDKIRQLRERDAAATNPNPKAEPVDISDTESSGWDTAVSALEGASDFVRQVPQKIPLISPLAQSAAAGITAAIDPNATYEDKMKEITDGVAARDAQSPIAGMASDVAGAVVAPGANIAGLPGVATSLGVSAADQVAKRDLTNRDISDEDMANNLALEAGAGSLGHGLGKVAGKLVDSDMYRALAQKFGKKTLGGTKGQLEKLDVKSDALDNSVNRLLDDENVFDAPFQSKEELYNKILARRKESGKAGADIFEKGASPANQAETYDKLMAQAKEYRNKGQVEIAAKLETEAGVIKGIDSKSLGIEQPITASPEDLKYIEMQNTELDPNIIKGRKSQLDEQAYGNKLQVDKNAAAAAGDVRDMQYGLMNDPSSLKAENARYGDLLTAENLASKSAAGEISNSGGLIGVAKKGVGSTAGAIAGSAFGPAGTIAGGMLGGAAQSLLSNFGPQLATYGFNGTSKILKNNKWAEALSAAGERGGAAGVGTAHFLLTQRDPEYRKTYQEDQDASKDK